MFCLILYLFYIYIPVYRLQQEAPKPRAVHWRGSVPLAGRPSHYGPEFHGVMDHCQAGKLLQQDGDYLVRMSNSQVNTTCCLSLFFLLFFLFRFRNKVKHYKLFFDGAQHYVGDKRFDSLDDLVADGLVTLHIEAEAGSYVQLMCDLAKYEKSPAYVTLNRLKKRQQREQDVTAATSIVAYDKPHSFKTHNFKGLNWCEFCSNFLWGFTAQGVKCEDCGFSAHFKCSEKLPADCWPELKQVRSVFGVDLTTLVRAHRTLRPFVVDKCIDEIEHRGLDAEGLYRVSGFADEMDAMRMALDRDGSSADISAAVYDNINVVAGILKLYFRLLPIPLLTYEVHPVLIKVVHLPSMNEQLQGTKEALALLPPAHYNTLKFLMAHLYRVVKHCAENKMSAQNLGTIFAPTLMPVATTTKNGGRGGGGGGSIPDMTSEINVICLLIQYYHEIFQTP
ncbi:hypothetical protein AAG570_010226 [Ranatra chinensis]|uniref:Beta-chimaerin n=1 Tax=Ranatra chinensis TaxID=642074 RepID=A0ABD0ZAA0_9HEMI